MGALSTFLVTFITLAYAYGKTEVLISRKDVDVFQTTRQNDIPDSYVMDYSQGLNFAVGFTAFDDVREPILDPTIATLEFKSWEWGIDFAG